MPAPEAAARPLRSWTKNFAVACIALLAALLTSELALRVTGLDSLRVQMRQPGADRDTTRYDAELGWANLADVEFLLSKIQFRTNAQGFRSNTGYATSRSEDTRVAILGDSQVFGLRVPFDEHFVPLLDARSEDLEVYGFGVAGYGPSQELLLLRRVLQRYEPDHVIVVLFLENDLIDAVSDIRYGMAKPYAETTANGLMVRNIPVPIKTRDGAGRPALMKPHAGLFRRSAIFRTLVQVATTHGGPASQWLEERGLLTFDRSRTPGTCRRVDRLALQCMGSMRQEAEHLFDGLAVTVEIMKEMDRACRQSGATFTVLVNPNTREMREGIFEMTPLVVAALSNEGLDLIDLSAGIERQSRRAGAFLAPDRHWNAAGHELAAELIHSHLSAGG